MKYNIILTKQADANLRSIYEYIAFTLLEPKIAAGQLDRLEKCILGLDEMPERFSMFEKEPWRSRGLRQMPVDNFIVFYITITEDKTVNVIRFMYGEKMFMLDVYNKLIAAEEQLKEGKVLDGDASLKRIKEKYNV